VSDQVTPVFAVPVTVAVNWLDWPAPREIEDGIRLIALGTSVTLAVADLLGSTALVAVTVAICCALIAAGAVYTPFIKDPGPVRDHDTAV
jgi:hypothetical protein